MSSKATPGQALHISARQWNTLADVADAWRRGTLSPRSLPGGGVDPNVLEVRNDTGGDLDVFAAVELADVVFTPTDNEDTFKWQYPLAAVLPTTADAQPLRRLQTGITQAPIGDGRFGLVRVNGVTPARVDVLSVHHRWATVQDESPLLKSSSSGGARILWRENQHLGEPDGLGEQWCVVRVGTGHDVPRYQAYRFDHVPAVAFGANVRNQVTRLMPDGVFAWQHPDWEYDSGTSQLTCRCAGYYRWDVTVSATVAYNSGPAWFELTGDVLVTSTPGSPSTAGSELWMSEYHLTTPVKKLLHRSWSEIIAATAGQTLAAWFNWSALSSIAHDVQIDVLIGERIEW